VLINRTYRCSLNETSLEVQLRSQRAGGRTDRSTSLIKARWFLDESWSRFGLLFAHDLRANAFAFVARENRYTLFRIMRSAKPIPIPERQRLIVTAIVLAPKLHWMQSRLARHNQPATKVSAPDLFRRTARGGPVDSDLRHAVIIENFCSEIDRP
jgi:hypothetical protein